MSRDALRDRYREWLTDHVKAQHGFDREIAAKADAVVHGVRNSAPPVELWANIVPTIRVVERLRGQFGPTVINSAYRNRLYNNIVGGSLASRHMQNDALDVRCREGSPREWVAFLRDLRTQGVFAGGIGTYRSGFVHVDTRGVNVDWDG